MTYFITVPETELSDGSIVPAFRVGQFVCSKGTDGKATSTPSGIPWHSISYDEARQSCADIGGALITERQWLAIVNDVSKQDCNWTGGKFGEGDLFQGIRNCNVNSAQPGYFKPTDESERRWMTLSNGERICDINGNIYQWVFDDVQGDKNGIVANTFAEDSVSITAPHKNVEKVIRCFPFANDDWSFDALIRAGCWRSKLYAGAFSLNYGLPGYRRDVVGFRCTKPC